MREMTDAVRRLVDHWLADNGNVSNGTGGLGMPYELNLCKLMPTIKGNPLNRIPSTVCKILSAVVRSRRKPAKRLIFDQGRVD